MIQIGDKAPDLLGCDENGQQVRLSDFKGRTVALYFYPKDSTPGCTAQACNLRDNYTELLKAGYQVIGVSVDSAKSHTRFREKNALPFPLVCDTDHRLVQEFGVWAQKKMCGRSYMGTLRTTFIINPDGVVERIIDSKEVNTKNHAAQILKQMAVALLVACMSALAACTVGGNVSDDLATAEQAVDTHNYDLAKSICESFVTDSTTTLSAAELCRLSLIYMKLSDIDDPEFNTAAATQCYRSALRSDSDSAVAYYNSVPVDEARHIEIMSQLNRILSTPAELYLQDEDSVDMNTELFNPEGI